MMKGGAVLTVEDVKDAKRLDILLDLTTSQSVPHPPNHFQIYSGSHWGAQRVGLRPTKRPPSCEQMAKLKTQRPPALWFAASQGFTQDVERLLDHGVNIDQAVGAMGTSPLHVAAFGGHSLPSFHATLCCCDGLPPHWTKGYPNPSCRCVMAGASACLLLSVP